MHRITLPMAFAAPGRSPLGAITTSVTSASEPGGSSFATTLPGLGAIRDGTSAQPPLFRLTNLETGREWDFRQAVIPVGRKLHLATDVYKLSISRRQAEISVREGQIFVADHSTWGTYVNGDPLPKGTEREVFPGDFLRFGRDISLPVYLVNLPESEKAPTPVDYPAVLRDARARVAVKVAEADRQRVFLLTIPGGSKLLELTKRTGVLDLFLDPDEPHYANLPPVAGRLARLYDGFHYLRSAGRRMPYDHKLDVTLLRKPNGQPILIHSIRHNIEEDLYITDLEEGIRSVWLNSRHTTLPYDQRQFYEGVLAAARLIPPRELKERIENETGKFYFPHPIAFVSLEDLFWTTPPQSAGT